MNARTFALLILLIITGAAGLQAQHHEPVFAPADTSEIDVRSPWRPMRIAKWTGALASTGAAAYGFTQNRRADRDYEQLELECQANPERCLKLENGQYADAAMEQRYQRIVQRDRRARTALLAGQIGLVASVIMFIIDLPDRETPEDIPYEPRPLRFNLRGDGSTEVSAQLRLPGF